MIARLYPLFRRPFLLFFLALLALSSGLAQEIFRDDFEVAGGVGNSPPVAEAGSNLAVLAGTAVDLDGSASRDDDGDGLSYRWSLTAVEGGTPNLSGETTATPRVVTDQPGTLTLQLVVNDGTVDSPVDTVVIAVLDTPPPADPETTAPPVDPGVTTILSRANEFLYTGEDPIQSGVDPVTIDVVRAAVLRGKVMDRNGEPLPGVRVTVLNHPEYGSTRSRADGMFDMVVNGGGWLVVSYELPGFLQVQRRVDVPWRDFALVPDVAMTPFDSNATSVNTRTARSTTVARGSRIEDGDGSRQATLLIPAGVEARMRLPDGRRQVLSEMNIRATEYTVGDTGPAAMPGDLPPTSAYTYAVELSVDEAVQAGATTVEFDTPLPFYVENFLDFPVGTIVPVGAFDRQVAEWIPEPNGLVIAIVSESGGQAAVDVDGDGNADSGALLDELGITTDELTQLAGLYEAGRSLWRVPIAHFTPWDCNWGIWFDETSVPPTPPSPVADGNKDQTDTPTPDDPCDPEGAEIYDSVIQCQRQTLEKRIELVGTRLNLNYHSERTPGWKVASALEIPISGETIPDNAIGMTLEVKVAGQLFAERIDVQPNYSFSFAWDGLDAYDRILSGAQDVTVRVGYVYPALYSRPANFTQSFAALSSVPITGSRAREEITLWNEQKVTLTAPESRPSIGGWSLSSNHFYDPNAKVLFQGDGTRISAEAKGTGFVINRILSSGNQSRIRGLSNPRGIAVSADGTIFVADTNNHRVIRIGPDGTTSTVAGTGAVGFNGDGGLATQASLAVPADVALGNDGSLYIADGYNHRIRRVNANGIIETVAGNGQPGFGGDGELGPNAQLYYPSGIATAPDGAVYIADTYNQRVRRIGSDGRITSVAGTGAAGRQRVDDLRPDSMFPSTSDSPPQPRTLAEDGGSALLATLAYPTDVALDRDGNVYIADSLHHRIRKVTPAGIISTVAGTGSRGFSGDGGPATEASLHFPRMVAIGSDGSLLIGDSSNQRIRRVDPEGTISTLAGAGTTGEEADGGLAGQALLSYPTGLAVTPDDRLLVVDSGRQDVFQISRFLPGFDDEDVLIASPNGGEIYQFSGAGRHLRTLHSLTGGELERFGYDAEGRLVSVTDGDGNATTIQRNAAGQVTAIVGPYGQQTALAVDNNGFLASATNPSGETTEMGYGDGGLLTRFSDQRAFTKTYQYNSQGRLLQANSPDNSSQVIQRTESDLSYATNRSTRLGRTTRYEVDRLPEGGEFRTTTFPDGTTTRVETTGTGNYRTILRDGTVNELQQGPDQRFSLQAPVSQLNRITMGGLTREQSTSRSVELSSPGNPLSLLNLTNEITTNGKTTRNHYDANARTLTSQTPLGREYLTIIDGQGRPEQLGVGTLTPIDLSYDQRGRLASVRHGDRQIRFAFNALGQVSQLTDATNQTISFEYDSAGRLIRQILPDSEEFLLEYDAIGNAVSLTPPGRPAHQFSYTSTNQIASYTPPIASNSGSISFFYNDDQQLVRMLRSSGLSLDYNYNDAGRLASMQTPDGIYSYNYNSNGQLSRVESPGGNVLEYSFNGSLLRKVNFIGEVSGVVDYFYDTDFRIRQNLVNGGNAIDYSYDADGFISQAGAISLLYDQDNGLLIESSLGDVMSNYSYNDYGDLNEHTVNFNGVAIYNATYSRDNLGRIITKNETVNGSSNTYEYIYDGRGRLIETRQNSSLLFSYTYDSQGNRTGKNNSGITEVGIYDDQDRLTNYNGASYSYTSGGELATKIDGSETTQYQYDFFGNLRTVTLPDGTFIEYLIDGRNRRIGKKVNGVMVQGFLYEDQLNPIAELDGSGNIISRFVYGGFNNIPDYMIKGGEIFKFIPNNLGSPMAIINASSGQIAQQISYDEFGNQIVDTNPGFQPFGFGGGIYDQHTLLVRLGARDYDSLTGRWTTKDRAFFGGGSLNFYTYSFNDPINWVDSNGFEPSKDIDQLIKERSKPVENNDRRPGFADDLRPSHFAAVVEDTREYIDKGPNTPNLSKALGPAEIAIDLAGAVNDAANGDNDKILYNGAKTAATAGVGFIAGAAGCRTPTCQSAVGVTSATLFDRTTLGIGWVICRTYVFFN